MPKFCLECGYDVEESDKGVLITEQGKFNAAYPQYPNGEITVQDWEANTIPPLCKIGGSRCEARQRFAAKKRARLGLPKI